MVSTPIAHDSQEGCDVRPLSCAPPACCACLYSASTLVSRGLPCPYLSHSITKPTLIPTCFSPAVPPRRGVCQTEKDFVRGAVGLSPHPHDLFDAGEALRGMPFSFPTAQVHEIKGFNGATHRLYHIRLGWRSVHAMLVLSTLRAPGSCSGSMEASKPRVAAAQKAWQHNTTCYLEGDPATSHLGAEQERKALSAT